MTTSDGPVPAFQPRPEAAYSIAPAAWSGARAWALALLAAVAAGTAAWAIGEAMLVPEAGFQDKKARIMVSPSKAGTRNGIISFGALGAAAGLALGAAGGLVARSARRGVLAGATGLFVGAGAAVGLSWFTLPIYYRHAADGELTYSLLVHGGVWAGAAAAAGLAFGIGLGGWRTVLGAIFGGAAGGLLAAVIYEFGGGMLVPRALTDRPISQTWQTRLAARLLVTVLAAAGMLFCAQGTGGKTAPNEPKT